MRLKVALRLARASNLPTVWTNVAAGVALAGGHWDARFPLLLVALSLFYIGGMFLNDAFDREFDAQRRPDRPIPAGQAAVVEVFGVGFGALLLGLAMLMVVALAFSDSTHWGAPFGGVLLAGAIVLYDAHHKSNPLSPLVMGACRMLVYVTAALAVARTPPTDVYLGALVLLSYLIGLTYAAKQEHLARLEHAWPLGFLAVPVFYGALLAGREPDIAGPLLAFTLCTLLAVRRLLRRAPGDVPRAVVLLIAGIALFDAVLLAAYASPPAAALAMAGFVLTLALQRWIAGT